MLTLIQLITYQIWESRNNYKYEKINLKQKTIISKINSKIRTIINAHFKFIIKLYLNQFKKVFCINNALAKIEDSKSTILIKPMV